MNLLTASLKTLRDGIRKKSFSAVEVNQAFLDQVNKLNPKLNAYITVNEDALGAARLADARIAKGDSAGALTGVPIAIKDMLCTRGLRTTAGSKILEGFIPPYSATVVARLENAGAITIGK